VMTATITCGVGVSRGIREVVGDSAGAQAAVPIKSTAKHPRKKMESDDSCRRAEVRRLRTPLSLVWVRLRMMPERSGGGVLRLRCAPLRMPPPRSRRVRWQLNHCIVSRCGRRRGGVRGGSRWGWCGSGRDDGEDGGIGAAARNRVHHAHRGRARRGDVAR